MKGIDDKGENMDTILGKLNKLKNKKFAKFQAKLLPTIKEKKILGVKTPDLRKLAKKLVNEEGIDKFLDKLPHKFFDENQLHAFVLSEIKDYNLCMKKVNKFLPYIDNWATCDQLSPKVFKKNKKALLKEIKKWLKSKKAFTIRFAISMLMEHFLDEDFDARYLKWVADVKNKNIPTKITAEDNPDLYYIEMMRAWYFATALAKKFKDTMPYIKNKKLNTWTHNKTIQKALESFRISDSVKKTLRKLKV